MRQPSYDIENIAVHPVLRFVEKTNNMVHSIQFRVIMNFYETPNFPQKILRNSDMMNDISPLDTHDGKLAFELQLSDFTTTRKLLKHIADDIGNAFDDAHAFDIYTHYRTFLEETLRVGAKLYVDVKKELQREHNKYERNLLWNNQGSDLMKIFVGKMEEYSLDEFVINMCLLHYDSNTHKLMDMVKEVAYFGINVHQMYDELSPYLSVECKKKTTRVKTILLNNHN